MSIVDQIKSAAILGLAKNPFAIVGTMGAGNVLTVTPLNGYAATSSTTYQWTRNGVDIAGQTASTYTQLTTDRSATIGCRVAGLANSAVAGTVPVVVPGAPTGISASAGNGSVTGTFTAPADNGGSAITGYQMAVYRASDNAYLGSANGSASPLTLNGLTNGVAVYVTVAAVNAIGVGAPSAASSPVTPSPVISALSSITVLGDSLMAYGNPALSGSGPASGGGMSTSHVGWANDKLREMGLPGFDILQFRAVGGTNLATCLSTMVPPAVSDTTDGAWVHIGVNSFNNGISGYDTLANNIAVAKQIVDALSAAKKYVIVDSIDPVSQSGITGAKGRATEFPQYNAAMKAYCDAKPNVIWLDTYSVMIDPASAQLNPLPGLIQNYDGIHRTSNGAKVSGYSVVNTLVSRLNLTRYKTPGSNLLSPMGTTGGTNTPGSGTVSGSIPTDWNVQNVAGSANVTVSVVNGKTRIVATNPSASAAVIYLQATNNAALVAACTNGSSVQGGFDFSIVSASSMTRLAGTLRFNGSTGTLWSVMGRDTANEDASNFVFPSTPLTGKRFTNPFTFGANASAAEFIIAIGLDAVVGATATIDISNPVFTNLT